MKKNKKKQVKENKTYIGNYGLHRRRRDILASMAGHYWQMSFCALLWFSTKHFERDKACWSSFSHKIMMLKMLKYQRRVKMNRRFNYHFYHHHPPPHHHHYHHHHYHHRHHHHHVHVCKIHHLLVYLVDRSKTTNWPANFKRCHSETDQY